MFDVLGKVLSSGGFSIKLTNFYKKKVYKHHSTKNLCLRKGFQYTPFLINRGTECIKKTLTSKDVNLHLILSILTVFPDKIQV